jgi:hypothetical protein
VTAPTAPLAALEQRIRAARDNQRIARDECERNPSAANLIAADDATAELDILLDVWNSRHRRPA